MTLNFFRENTKKFGEQSPSTVIIVFLLSCAGLYLAGYYLREFDWLGTTKWFEGLGLVPILDEKWVVMGEEVSKEYHIVSIVLWIWQLMAIFLFEMAGPWILEHEQIEGTTWDVKLKNAVSPVNWVKFSHLCQVFFVGRFDDYTDAAARAVNGKIGIEHIVYAVVVMGIFSEIVLGYSIKFSITTGAILFHKFLGYDLFGIASFESSRRETLITPPYVPTPADTSRPRQHQNRDNQRQNSRDSQHRR